jgi:hypothetical protein
MGLIMYCGKRWTVFATVACLATDRNTVASSAIFVIDLMDYIRSSNKVD